MEDKFRYPGARPFNEDDWYLFFGRDRDKRDLANLIELEQVVVLFGKSGYGKSSLLNAAVIPYLKRFERHEVVTIRLIEPTAAGQSRRSPLEIIRSRLEDEAEDWGLLQEKLNIPVELPDDLTAQLWYYAKTLELTNEGSRALTLVFDQFEELRQFGEHEIAELGHTLNSLLYLQAPKSVRELITEKMASDQAHFSEGERREILRKVNLKVVFSLHQDRLSLLDKLKDAIPEIYKYTYELKPLEESQALEALHKPAKLEGDFKSPVFSFQKEASEYIIDSLKNNADQRIEPFQLQLLAQHAEEKIIAKKSKAERLTRATNKSDTSTSANYIIERSDLDDPKKIYRKHYVNAIATLPFLKRADARNCIENGLIIDSNRVPLPEPLILKRYNVSRDSLDDLQEKRLLRSALNTVQGTSWELSHDTLIPAIQDSAEKRKRRRLWILVISLFLLIIAGLLFWALYERGRNDEGNGIIINPLVTATVDPTSGEGPMLVNFTYRITDSISDVKVNKVFWDFGDGTSSKAGSLKYQDILIQHQYTEVRKYEANLIVFTDDGKRRREKVDIEVLEKVAKEETGPSKPGPETDPIHPAVRNIEIYATPPGGRAPIIVQFSLSDTLQGGDREYQWKINDSVFSTAPNPSYEFKQEGLYRIVLETEVNDGTKIVPREISIAPPQPDETDTIGDTIRDTILPVAIALPDSASGRVPYTVEFRGESSTPLNTGLAYKWDFGNNITSDLVNPSHVFTEPGSYSVVLTVSDSLGNASSDSVPITVIPDQPPIASALATYTAGSRGILTENFPATISLTPLSRVGFDGTSSTDDVGLAKYEWDFGDGVTAVGESVEHTFINIGKHDIKLTVHDTGGQTASVSATVEVTIKRIDPIANYRTWMQRFKTTQNNNLDEIRDENNSWRKHVIAPDSVNLIAVYFDQPSNTPAVSDNELPHLLFFFTAKGESKLFKFRSEIDTENMAEMRSERFNFNSLINVTSRNAQRNTSSRNALTRKLRLPDGQILSFESSTYKDLAGLFRENKSAKTLNFYYTVFPYSKLTEDAQLAIDSIYPVLGEPK